MSEHGIGGLVNRSPPGCDLVVRLLLAGQPLRGEEPGLVGRDDTKPRTVTVPSSCRENSTSSPSPMCSARLMSSGSVSCALARTLALALTRGCGSALAAGTPITAVLTVRLSYFLTLQEPRGAGSTHGARFKKSANGAEFGAHRSFDR